MRAIKNIGKKIKKISPGQIRELDHYLDYLIDKRSIRTPKKLKQEWAGGLKDVKITSIALQKSLLDQPDTTGR